MTTLGSCQLLSTLTLWSLLVELVLPECYLPCRAHCPCTQDRWAQRSFTGESRNEASLTQSRVLLLVRILAKIKKATAKRLAGVISKHMSPSARAWISSRC